MINGHNIKVLRTQKKMTQVALAQKLGVTVQTVINWEKGNVDNMKPRSLKMLEAELGQLEQTDTRPMSIPQLDELIRRITELERERDQLLRIIENLSSAKPEHVIGTEECREPELGYIFGYMELRQAA